ncbi:MAG: hypothetical protein OEZ43_13320 [Gammaproteobacteria bacterium]|nr:hypothetical protein [Gammaproteobacteria bacterium]
MQQAETIQGIQCKDCGFQGEARSNSSQLFLIFIAMILLSAFFLPLIILALAYLVWIISKPSKKSCPQCKSHNIETATLSLEKKTSNMEADESH